MSPRRSLTLIELLLVVFILAALAASAVSLAGDADGQSRIDLTELRRQQIHEAILGPAVSVGGAPVALGFVADMGRLPTSLRELIEPTDDAGAPLALAQASPVDGNLQGGWRGPYLPVQWEGSRAVFRDGWGTRRVALGSTDVDPGDVFDYGWDVPALTDAFDAVSLGRDGVAGGSGLDADVPTYPAPPNDHFRLVPADAWSHDFSGSPAPLTTAVTATLTLHNQRTTDLNPADVRVRIVVPSVGGASVDWTGTLWLSEAGTGSAVPPGDSATVEFVFPTSTPRLPVGTWSLEVVDATTGARVEPGRRLRLRARARSPLEWPSEPWVIQ
ncbi:MAG: hypothetical protein R3F62_23815 [Planctomycetota bacterium]